MNERTPAPAAADAPPVDENQIIAERRGKLAALRAAGQPFPNDFRRDALAADLHAAHGGEDNATLEPKAVAVTVAGRMMLKRVMGKACFATLQDFSGRIQLYVTLDGVGADTLDSFKRWDLGDIVGATGTLFRTKTGELSVKCAEVRLLSKSLRPLPEKFHGMTDQEQRYRQRYVDLITNPESRDVFVKRSQIVQAIREFFVARRYLEVETPMMHPIPGGAAARPFVTHHNALDTRLFLRIAPELYLKRLVVGGLERVFEINRNFRNEGISTRHNPEFTMLEFYEAYRDYRYLMDLTETLFREVAQRVLGTTTITYQGETIDLGQPFDRLTMAEAIHKYNPRYPLAELAKPEYLRVALAPFDTEVFATDGVGLLQLKLFEATTEEHAGAADVHRRAPDRRVAAGARQRRQPGGHRPLRAVHHPARTGERLFRAQRPGGPGGAVQVAGRGARGRRRGGDVLRRRLHPRARVRPAADGRRGHRHRPAGDAADRQPVDPRRHPVPAAEARGLTSKPSPTGWGRGRPRYGTIGVNLLSHPGEARPELRIMTIRAVDLRLTGMTCAACAARIEKVLNRADGVHAEVNYATETAHVEYDAGKATPQTLIEVVKRAGYGAAPAPDPFAQPEQEAIAQSRRYRRELANFAFAALLTAPFVAQMAFMASGRHDTEMPYALQCALAALVQFVAGWRFWRGAFNALRGGAANMDVLVALGTGVAFAFSLAVWLVPIPSQHVYFEAGAMIVTLVLLGKLLEGRARARTATAIRNLLALRPPTVHRERDGKIQEVPLAAVRVGDVFLVRGGDRVPVDGRVLDGESAIDEAMLTGESVPVRKVAGDTVLAGTVNENGRLRCVATAVGQATLLAGIVRQVSDAQGSKAPVQRLADRVAAVFVPAVLAIAAVTLVANGLAARRLGGGADARDRGAGDRLPVRAGPRHADGADGGRGPRRAGRHPDQERGGAGARAGHRRADRRQDRDVDRRQAARRRRIPGRRIHGPRADAARRQPRDRRGASAGAGDPGAGTRARRRSGAGGQRAAASGAGRRGRERRTDAAPRVAGVPRRERGPRRRRGDRRRCSATGARWSAWPGAARSSAGSRSPTRCARARRRRCRCSPRKASPSRC